MKNLKEVIKEVAKKGGVTFNPNFADNEGNYLIPKNGYAVSLPNYELKSQSINVGLLEFIKTSANLVSNSKDFYIGIWLNKLDGFYYFDVSVNIQSLDAALKLGFENKQIAIYDLNNSKDIVLPKVQSHGTIEQSKSYIKAAIKNYTLNGSFYLTYK